MTNSFGKFQINGLAKKGFTAENIHLAKEYKKLFVIINSGNIFDDNYEESTTVDGNDIIIETSFRRDSSQPELPSGIIDLTS